MSKATREQVAGWRAKKRVVKSRGDTVAKPAVKYHQPTPAELADLESNCPEWLRHFMPEAYSLPFGDGHRELIAGAVNAIESGGNYAVVAPRGEGKSTTLQGVVLWAVATKRKRFPAYLPWAARDYRKALRFWKNQLCFNSRLAASYPQMCAPFVMCKGSSPRLMNLTHPDGTNTGARLQINEGMIVLPDSLGVIGSATVNGNPRGLNHSTESGEVLRPDMGLIDDPQDKETAKSPTQVRNAIDVIDSDIAGMSGPDGAMPLLLSGTVIAPNDVMTHYLSDEAPDWKALLVKQVITWPTNTEIWDEFNRVRLEGEETGDKGAAGRKFYAEHRAELIDGMAVSWAERYDRKGGSPDALYQAMLDFYRMGRGAFMAERQGEPEEFVNSEYELTIENILSHVAPIPRLHVPPTTTILVGMCDINRSGLHWCIAGYDQMMTGHASAYGRWPMYGELWRKNAPELERKQAIFKGLRELTAQLATVQFMRAGKAMRVGLFLIDRGYEPDVVHKFCAAAVLPFRVMPSRGYAAHKYWPKKQGLVGTPMEGCHVTQGEAGNFLAFNADVWRETAQRAFLADPGAPGGFTIYESPNNPKAHAEFAAHIVAEKIANKYHTDAGDRWEWLHLPGSKWDWGDAVTGCWVAAAACGLSASGQPRIEKKRQSRRATGVSVVNI